MEGDAGEFSDWEMLHNSDAGILHSSDSTQNDSTSFDGIEGDSEGVIRSDYFSFDNQERLGVRTRSEDGSVESDNPSWIDPAIPERSMAVADFWSDSASDRSEDRKSGDLDSKKELSGVELGEFEALDHASREFGDFAKPSVKVSSGSEMSDLVADEEDKNPVVKPNGSEGEKRTMVWWKVPLVVLKYSAFKVSPVWAFSVAAAVLGMAMLGKRLYRMKRKTQTLQLKVTMDDKKVSQFMSRAGKLNDAFSVVKRVPIVRPALPLPANFAPWPVMSLR